MRHLTNKGFLPEPIVAALMNDKYVKRGDISVTSLIDSPKAQIIRSTVDYNEDVKELTWALLGSAMHVVMERAVEQMRKYDSIHNLPPRYASELEMEILCNGWKVTGTTDLVQKTPSIIWDYKNCSIWKIIKARKGICRYTGASIYYASEKEHDSWIKQLNIYAVMFKRIYGIKIESLRIIAILKDWKETEYRNDTMGDYPDSPIQIIELPMYDEDSVWRYMEERVAFHRYCRNIAATHGLDAVPECSPEERWQTPETWKFYKSEDAKRSVKNFEIKTEEDLNQAVAFDSAMSPLGYVKKVYPGHNVRCERYCPVNAFCNFYTNLHRK